MTYQILLRELRSRKTVRFLKQIISADKYPSIFSHQMDSLGGSLVREHVSVNKRADLTLWLWVAVLENTH